MLQRHLTFLLIFIYIGHYSSSVPRIYNDGLTDAQNNRLTDRQYDRLIKKVFKRLFELQVETEKFLNGQKSTLSEYFESIF